MLKKKDNSMNDEEWNAWTADVRVFLEEKLEASREQALTSGMDEEEFDDYREDGIHQLWLLLAAEGYRHIVCLIDNYARSDTVRTKNSKWNSDSGIALEQTCRAVHSWYYGKLPK